MKKRQSSMLILAGFLLALPGCLETQQQEPRPAPVKQVTPAVACPAFTEVKARHVVLMLLDRSGSVLDEAQERMATIRADAVSGRADNQAA